MSFFNHLVNIIKQSFWSMMVAGVAVSIAVAPVRAESVIYYVHSDHLGTPQVLTDNSQTVVWNAKYMPFGETEVNEDPDGDGVAVDMPLRFPGQYFDKETGLHYNYYRNYDPSLGRYIQSDPIGLAGGINTYVYVLNSPLIYADPTGENPVQGAAHGGRTGAQIGGAMGGLPGAVAGGILGAGLGAGIGWWAGDQLRDQFNDDTSDDAGDDAARKECEKECGLAYDRNYDLCRADAAMRGYNASRWRDCMVEIDRLYRECIMECNEKKECE